MKRISQLQQKIVAMALFALLLSFAGALSAQTQGTGNRVFTVNHIPLKLVFVKGGDMQLGCTESRDDSCKAREVPTHTVTLTDFYIGETEVTQAQWMAVMGRDNNPSYWKGNTLPVERVSWAECQRFVNRLNKYLAAELPQGYRFALPSEAQWEYAARAGNGEGYWGNGAPYTGSTTCTSLDALGRYRYNGGYLNNGSTAPTVATAGPENGTAVVGTHEPNAWGLYDMFGNVWEWCLDWYEDDIRANNGAVNINSTTPSQTMSSNAGSYRVRRGGAFSSPASDCRAAYRAGDEPNRKWNNHVGFRLVCNSLLQ